MPVVITNSVEFAEGDFEEQISLILNDKRRRLADNSLSRIN